MNKKLIYFIVIVILAFIAYTFISMGSFAQPTTYNQSGLSFNIQIIGMLIVVKIRVYG